MPPISPARIIGYFFLAVCTFASVLGVPLEEFEAQLSYLVEHDPEPRSFAVDGHGSGAAPLHASMRAPGL